MPTAPTNPAASTPVCDGAPAAEVDEDRAVVPELEREFAPAEVADVLEAPPELVIVMEELPPVAPVADPVALEVAFPDSIAAAAVAIPP